MVRQVSRDDEGHSAHGEGIVAGDTGSRPCFRRQIAEQGNRGKAYLPELPDVGAHDTLSAQAPDAAMFWS